MAEGSTPAPKKGVYILDPIKEAKAVQALRESLAQLGLEGDDELLTDSIEGETSLFEVVDKLLLEIEADTGMARGVGEVISDLEVRKERFERRVDARRALIEQAMLIAELPKIERPAATLSLANRPPKLVITEEADIPANYFVSEPKLDRKALAAALKDGAEVPGALLSNAAPSLTIRTK